MKKHFYTLLMVFWCSILVLAQNVAFSISPTSFNEDERITITFTGINENSFGTDTYLWSWATDINNGGGDCPTNGSWNNSNEANKLTRKSQGVYSISFIPKNFYGFTNPLKNIGFLVKNKNGSVQSGDMHYSVGRVTNNPNVEVITEEKPSWIQQGINYDANNPNKVGLALYAPHKDYVYVVGSFNNWKESSEYLMKKDTQNPHLFWLEISGLEAKKLYTFQYKTNDGIRVADPYSPLVLSPYDDKWISNTIYPNLPQYPVGQDYEVSVIQTGMPKYQWKHTNYTKPNKDNLIIYELLVRDFTEGKSWQSTMEKIPYIKALGVNAIQIMPIMEFEGNDSWGYNTSFHYAIDKAYGTAEKFKEFVDECHKNGIVVILDIALNHATQRNPLSRLWNIDPDGDGYGIPASNNPYFNQTATHSYPFFEDFNHASEHTRYYVKRVIEQWIKEYNIDGIRWDLTKGFTQNCTNNDDCTHAYQKDRVDVMKLYADYQWAVDPSSYVIFEHLGTDEEEKEWANYRLGEGKGIMLWDNLVHPYNENTMGYASSSNFNKVSYKNHLGFGERRNVSYAESHDEERLMYKNLQYGNAQGGYSVKNLDTALQRMKALGAVLFTVPGPKMIWQFGELGYDFSINHCTDGSVKNDCRTDAKPIAFQLGYDNQANRKDLYDTWAKIIKLRLNNEVFNTNTFEVQSGDLIPKIYIWNDNISIDKLKNVVIVANFTLTPQSVVPYVPFDGNWYNLLDNSVISFTSTDMPIHLEAGDFKILGNAPTQDNTLSTISNKVEKGLMLKVLQNPIQNREIKLRVENAQKSTLYLYDFAGEMLKKVPVSQEKGEISLSVSDLASGVYLLQLKSEKETAVAKVILK